MLDLLGKEGTICAYQEERSTISTMVLDTGPFW
jgi:hypothetical protein